MKTIDKFLDKITMYRLVLWHLIILVLAAVFFSAFNIISFNPVGIIYSAIILCLVSWIANKIFSLQFKIPTNIESVYITSLILCLIITPPQTGEYLSALPFLITASFVAMASKYLVNVSGKHIFNPAAFAVVFTTFVILKGPSWWISVPQLLPLVIAGGILITRKLREFHLVLTYLVVSLLVTALFNFRSGNIIHSIYVAIGFSQLLFFGTIMLTEPLTAPLTRNKRVLYGVLVGILSNPLLHFGTFFMSPEVALLIGNIFSFGTGTKKRFTFVLEESRTVSEGIKEFIFNVDKKLDYKAGQYMEWTLNVKKSDARGNRRYFTIASSPTESNPCLGVRFYPEPSTFKRSLDTLSKGDEIHAGQISGEFTLPKDKSKKLVFLAGGIGITPFRSMIKYLIDMKERRNIVLIYSNRLVNEIAYQEIFKEGENFGLKTICTLSETKELPEGWNGETGFIDEKMIKNHIPDFKERTFYISGSHLMVTAFKEMLQKMGVKKSQIKTDFFPGLV
jgi:glycine betaine catabolism B